MEVIVVEELRSKRHSESPSILASLGLLALMVLSILVLSILINWLFFLFWPATQLRDYNKITNNKATEVVDILSQTANASEIVPMQEQLDEISGTCQKAYYEWQECMAAHREINRLVQDYYQSNKESLDKFDPHLKDNIASLNESTKTLEDLYSRYRKNNR